MTSLLAAGIAHEINTPLGTLLSSTDTMGRAARKIQEWCQAQPPEKADLVKRPVEALSASRSQSRAACERIHAIVANLTQFAQLDRADIQRADIRAGLESTIRLLRPEFAGHIEVITEFGELPAIDCAPRKLNQLFMNLLLNAKEAIARAGRPGVVRVRALSDRDSVKIEISDNGCGIAPAWVPMGIGLSICCQIVRMHRGRIDVSSTPGQGTTFTVTLPARLSEIESQNS